MLSALVQQLTYLKPYPRLYWDQLPSAGRLGIFWLLWHIGPGAVNVLGMRHHHVEHCKAQRWITVFAKCLLHVFRSDVDFLFEKWVNADSQFLTFVVTVLGISA